MQGAKDFLQRTRINTASGLLLCLVLWASRFPAFRWIFVVAVVGVAAVALWEYGHLLREKGLHPPLFLLITASACYLISLPWSILAGPIVPILASASDMILAGALFVFFVHSAITRRAAIVHIATSLLGLLYIAVPLGCILRILYFFAPTDNGTTLPGSWWVIYLIAITKVTDIGGYMIGRFFGRHKLAPLLSPRKTVEGALGGIIAALGLSLYFAFLGTTWLSASFSTLTYPRALLIGGLIALFGQMGDLAESLLKRDAQVKDSNKIPGVGGILDMIDSPLFTAPLLYFFLKVGFIG